ncbi:phage holin family protein [Clostridium bowmanii]|uniref:phage holin family protein n=1 Tax=Clostridium bowmanii TaxID=132925 RepID=UPI001C0E151D|nr:phage holin family protein [Clostridium bowmanii]MBU3188860.1 phage holin family protein [Clostridium bowmanii]MCA1073734.1 phage holin family protein [Clostridium bowmanii]
MVTNENPLKIYEVSGILGFLSNMFTSMQTSYIILLVLIILDTFTGISTAIKYKRFSSTGLRKATKKVITYTLCIITVRLLEAILSPLITTSMLSQIITAYLGITESVSILENLTLLGVPISANIIPLLIKTLKIPLLNTILETSKNKKNDFSDIDDIINYQIPTFEDKYIRRFLEIKCDVIKCIINQILLIDETTSDNMDIFFYKILSTVELGFNDMNKKWEEEKIPTNYIKNLSSQNQPKVAICIGKLKGICYSDKSTSEKKNQIIDCILIILYQTIIDARKII